jgi:predicted MPP superfamily phosphohydrolase
MGSLRNKTLHVGAAAAAAGAAAASYMAFEAQWPVCRRTELAVPGLPAPWSGVTVLHLSDVHAGLFATNERSLEKAVSWAVPLVPDLVFLTGDMLGDPRRSARTVELLAQLQPPLGMFAVTGNHEYGLGKGPLAKARDVRGLWAAAGVTLLRDACVVLPDRGGSRLLLCGADYLTSGFGLLESVRAPGSAGAFPILLIHRPPPSDSPLAAVFPLAFAGHTHGGQLRVPGASGLRALVDEPGEYLSGVYQWGWGRLVVSRGVGTSFLPFRLLTRPEATLWRLV